MPAGNWGTVNSPTPVVTVELCVPIAALVTVILAPDTTAPVGSVTVPDTLPRSLCAKHNPLPHNSAMNSRLKFKYLSQLTCCVISLSLASREVQWLGIESPIEDKCLPCRRVE